MKPAVHILWLLALLLSAALGTSQAPHLQSLGVRGIPSTAPKAERPTGFPLLFVENRGRYEDHVRYHVEHQDGVILLTDTGIVFRDHGRGDIVLGFPGSNPATHLRAESRSPTVVHYLIGKEDAWRTDVPTFRRVRYANLWPGIELVLRGDPGLVKYEFHVAPGADPRQIRMRYVGARLALDTAGHLEVRDAEGLRRTDPVPLAFQSAGGDEAPVAAEFELESGNPDTVGFSVGAYDRSRPLVIDPAFLVYSGYLVPGMVNVYDIAVDANGAALVVGIVTTPDPYGDACIVRIRPDGTGFDFVTYLGSPNIPEAASSVAVDASGIYVGGGTYADERSFPVKVGPDLTYNGGGDGFVCKLAHDGKTIIYCGYVGGSLHDGFAAMAIDGAGAVWLAGQTQSADYPVKGGPQLKMPGPIPACVTKVAPDGRSLLVSGYIGGLGPWFYTNIVGVAVDGNGDGYVAGDTGSDQRTFPVKVGPSLTLRNGSYDTFVGKIDGRTGGILYCGYIGGANTEYTWNLAVDAQGAAYVTGGTRSDETTFPVVAGPLLKYTPTTSQRGNGFVAKVKASGTGLAYAGFLSGFVAEGVAVDAQQRCYLGGHVDPGYHRIPVGGALSTIAGGGLDSFVARLSANGRTFEYAGYLGGAGTEAIHALARDARGVVYVTGQTYSNGTFPLKTGPSSVYNLGKPPASPNLPGTFITKIAESAIIASGTGRIGTPVTISLLANDDPGFAYQVGTSLGTGPIPIDTRTLNLSPDGLLFVSTSGFWPGIFSGYRGVIDSKGQAQAIINIPNATVLIGTRLHTAFVTLNPAAPSGIRSISNTDSFTIAK